MDIHDKEQRRQLMEKYLNADTSLAEEMMLADWFAANAPQPDEEAFARLVELGAPDSLTTEEAASESGADEFDRMMGQVEERRQPRFRKTLVLTAAGLGVAAAIALAAILWRPSGQASCNMTMVEIAESLTTLTKLNMGNVESVTARPVKSKFIVTVTLKGGKTSSYIMTKDSDSGAIELLAKGSD